MGLVCVLGGTRICADPKQGLEVPSSTSRTTALSCQPFPFHGGLSQPGGSVLMMVPAPLQATPFHYFSIVVVGLLAGKSHPVSPRWRQV